MAKLSTNARNLKRIRMVNYAYEVFKKLKLKVKKGTVEEQEAAMITLQKRTRDKSPVRLRCRCRQCGRPRGTIKKFGLCRICVREAAMRGDIPGLRKAAW